MRLKSYEIRATILLINFKEARQERGPRPAGERRESRLEQLADKQAMKQVARMGRMKQIQLKKTWNPCVNG